MMSGMNEEQFWKIVSRLNWKLDDDEEIAAPAVKALARLDEEAIHGFEELLAQKLFALDTRAHARAMYEGQVDVDDGDQYLSADDFLYRRCFVVAKGRDLYQRVLAQPDQAPSEGDFEALLSLASDAFEEKTGDELEPETSVSYESFSNKAGWAATENTRSGQFTSGDVPPGNRRPS